jgi:DNA-binding winged helix-turn-helix (wHTH) protein
MNSQDDLRQRHPLNRRIFVSMVAAGAASTLVRGTAAAAQVAPMARNVVLVHGLFADGSSWSEVIARLQAAGLNATSVQNPLTTLPEAVASAERVLARQDGPTVLVNETVLRIGPLELDLIDRAAKRGDRRIDLLPREFQLLKYMMQRSDKVLSRATLLKEVWHYKFVPRTNLVDVQMGRLRHKVDGANEAPMIRNVRGVGFVLDGIPLSGDSRTTQAARSMPALSHLSLISQPDEITWLIMEAAGQAT